MKKTMKRNCKSDVGYHTIEYYGYGQIERWRDNKTGRFVEVIKD